MVKIVPKIQMFLGIFPVTLILDIWTKMSVLDHFQLGETLPIITNYFNLTYVQNTGAAFSLLADAPEFFRKPFFLFTPIVALSVLSFLFAKLPSGSRLYSSALSCVMAGALGNLIDRARFGYVIDFLDFHWQYQAHFPVFNVADISICVGVGLLLIDLWKKPNESLKG